MDICCVSSGCKGGVWQVSVGRLASFKAGGIKLFVRYPVGVGLEGICLVGVCP